MIKNPKRTKSSKPDAERVSGTALESRFVGAFASLAPQRQRLIRSILENCEETCFLSSRELARRYRVDGATVVRTIQALGYKSFADFSADLRQHFVTRLTPYTVLKAATHQKGTLTDHIDHSLDKALQNLNGLRSELDRTRLIELGRLIHRSTNILVVGLDLAASLAQLLAYGLCSLGFRAQASSGGEGSVQQQVRLLTEKDVLIAISFGQCLKVVVEAVIRAREQGVPTFGITDSDTTPIARYSDSHAVTSIASPSFLSSYASPVTLIHAIHVTCAHLNPKRSLRQLEPTEKEYVSGTRWYRESKSNGGRK